MIAIWVLAGVTDSYPNFFLNDVFHEQQLLIIVVNVQIDFLFAIGVLMVTGGSRGDRGRR